MMIFMISVDYDSLSRFIVHSVVTYPFCSGVRTFLSYVQENTKQGHMQTLWVIGMNVGFIGQQTRFLKNKNIKNNSSSIQNSILLQEMHLQYGIYGLPR